MKNYPLSIVNKILHINELKIVLRYNNSIKKYIFFTKLKVTTYKNFRFN